MRRLEFDVLPREAIAVDVALELLAQRSGERSPRPCGSAVMNTVYQLPGPAQRGYGVLHLGIHFGDALVVGHGDGALLRHERLGRAAANLVGSLRIRAAHSGQRIGAAVDARVGAEDERIGAEIARRTVAQAIGGA